MKSSRNPSEHVTHPGATGSFSFWRFSGVDAEAHSGNMWKKVPQPNLGLPLWKIPSFIEFPWLISNPESVPNDQNRP